MEYTNTLKVLNEFAQEVIAAYKEGLTQYDAIASRELINSVKVHTVSADEGNLIVSIDLAEYWKYVENGRKAYGADYKGHLPPISAIERWITFKHISGGDTQRGVPSYASLTPNLGTLNVQKNTNSLAWAIATKIAQKGIEPKPILQGSVKEVLMRFRNMIAQAVAKDLGSELRRVASSVFSGVELQKSESGWSGNVVTDTIYL